MASFSFDTDLTTLSESDLYEFQSACYSHADAVNQELQRRAALPFVWASEEQSVKTLRKVTGTAPVAGAEFKQPASLLDAYVAGDTVTVGSARWEAVAKGAIFVAPGTIDPIQGAAWNEVIVTTAGTTGEGESEAIIED